MSGRFAPAAPSVWWDVELPRAVPSIAAGAAEGDGHTVADLASPDRELARRLLAATRTRFGAPADTAATFLTIWTAGAVARAVGATWAIADAGLLVEARTVRFVPGHDAPVDHVRLGTVEAVVGDDHPWAGAPGVQVLEPRTARRDVVVARLVACARPVVEALHGCARVGRAGLWNQVGDGLVDWLTRRTRPPVTDRFAAAAMELARAPGRPWRATARAWTVPTAGGPAFVVRKAGCCLEHRVATADHVDDDDGRAYLAAFPLRPGERITCATCPLRDRADAEARQRFWIGREASR